MPVRHALLCALALLAAAAARADVDVAPVGEALPGSLGGGPAAPPLAAAARRSAHLLGLQLDGGVPDGAGVSVLYRPWRYLRTEGGLLYNGFGYGVRGGVTVLPYFPLAPTLTLEAGHYFDGNAAARVAKYTTVSDGVRPLLSSVGYTFVNAQVGLEVGHPNWFVFFVRAGLSRVWYAVHGADAAAKASTSGDLVVTHMDDPSGWLSVPNVKAGLILYFY